MVPFMHQFSASVLFGTNCTIFGCKFRIIIKEIDAINASSECAILDEFSEQN